MRRRAFCLVTSIAVLLTFADFSEASPILVTQAASQGHDSAGRLIGHVAAFQNNFRAVVVWSLDDSIPVAAAALAGPERPVGLFDVEAALARESRGLGRGRNDELAVRDGDDDDLDDDDEDDDSRGREVRNAVITALLESEQGSVVGLLQALSNGSGNGNSTGDDDADEDVLVVGNVGNVTVTPNQDSVTVPEPASLLFLGFGLVGLCTSGRRRTN